MKKLDNITITVYDFDCGWKCDLFHHTDTNYVEVWIYREPHGMKTLMWGENLTENKITFENFLEELENCFDDYKLGYLDDSDALETFTDLYWHIRMEHNRKNI